MKVILITSDSSRNSKYFSKAGPHLLDSTAADALLLVASLFYFRGAGIYARLAGGNEELSVATNGLPQDGVHLMAPLFKKAC